MIDMHPVMVLVAFAIAAVTTYGLVLAALTATSVLPRESRDDVPDDPRDEPVPVPDVDAGSPLPPWVSARNDLIRH
ncbi:hypothetical protein EUA06_09945 [Nocardioides glacieisoli]|uniref:Uncharacterized protein n=1 Tax=Nocardioides glacieisoli TaxID=1168730 RepID=A0A4Q2RQ60_9ACTN|nr:hypothetical protein [Nocardioides glacieisoli]RYB90616.1 hypothetical protein EUA06_09945 [Nocardioides glacieisoli]